MIISARVVFLVIVLLGWCFGGLTAADKDSTGARASKDFGLYIGGAYSLGAIDSKPIEEFNASPKLSNSVGMLAGFCYNFYLGKKRFSGRRLRLFFFPCPLSIRQVLIEQRNDRFIQ